MTDREESAILSLDDVAEHFKCSTKSVQKMTREKALPFFMVGRLWRFRRADVLVWEEAQMQNLGSKTKGEVANG